ncbi:hypothetical protein [Cupriavidus sp. CuC1]|uniref:hypothetical protein n=1 Tax=Cupriavidus sp. CuC1 TaxID=3373131 RepID=UPI0037D5B31D
MQQSRIKATYIVAFSDAKAARGGEIQEGSAGVVDRWIRGARVGDKARYADGTEARITTGAGSALRYGSRPMAILFYRKKLDYVLPLIRQRNTVKCAQR